MNGKHYKLRFLPLFEEDLTGIVDYIAFWLKNPIAAEATFESNYKPMQIKTQSRLKRGCVLLISALFCLSAVI